MYGKQHVGLEKRQTSDSDQIAKYHEYRLVVEDLRLHFESL